MSYLRIDIKKGNVKLPFIFKLLKWVIMIYVILASVYLVDKVYYLLFEHNGGFYEWLAVVLNLVLIAILVRQLFRLNEVRYIIVTDNYIKYRQRFPWPYRISWGRIKQIHFGYSAVRFMTKKGNKFRFSLSKTNEEEQSKLYETLSGIAKKHGIDVLQPFLDESVKTESQ